MSKRALILGISGQDGSYLARHLLRHDYDVHGTSRRPGAEASANLARLGIAGSAQIHELDLADPAAIRTVLSEIGPSEVYQLSGQSSVGASFEDPAGTFQSIAINTTNLLESLRTVTPDARLFLAGSSECFGPTDELAGIETGFRPASPYAAAKASAHLCGVVYRKSFNLFVSNGVMFNHESPLRPDHFVTRKIVSAAARISLGSSECLPLGDLTVRRDWGWAPEFVEAMWLMLQHNTPGDFILATGETRSLEAFVDAVFGCLNLDWRDHVVSDPKLWRSSELGQSLADIEETGRVLGWRAEVKMTELAERLVRHELDAADQSGGAKSATGPAVMMS
ncbi:MAG: GDP-mannose 4,6-dehydratase [Rhodospirillaceae bacterium]|nr:GDP-mannose 4,6-dehydratase [Rhodospirillaceae bacterium]